MYRIKDGNGRYKYCGRSKAKVIDNRDPLNKGRVRLSHPLLGDSVWIEYLKTPAHFSVPSIGDVVFVECDSGEVEYPVAWGNITKGTNDSPNLPEAFRRDIPTNRGIHTPNGHLLEMDDGEAELTSNPDDTQFTTSNRGIRLTTADGSKVHLLDDSDNGSTKIIIEDPDGNSIIIDRDAGSMNLVIDGDFTVEASGSATIDTPATGVTGTLDVDGDVSAKANLNVTNTSMLGGGTPLLLSTAQFVGTGNKGAPVISSIMSGQATKVLGS